MVAVYEKNNEYYYNERQWNIYLKKLLLELLATMELQKFSIKQSSNYHI